MFLNTIFVQFNFITTTSETAFFIIVNFNPYLLYCYCISVFSWRMINMPKLLYVFTAPSAISNTRRNQFEFNLAFFEQAFVSSQLCLPYSISVISFITNWIWGLKSPSELTGAFEIIFSLIRAGLVWHKWWGLQYHRCRTDLSI